MNRSLRRPLLPLLALSLVACAEGATVEPAGSGQGGGAGADVDASHDGHAGSDGAAGDATVEASDGGAGGSDGGTDAPSEASNPCDNVTCNTPPANTCADANTLQVFNATGTCSNGQCVYSSSTTSCPCTNGACATNPCVGVTCSTPPKNHCADSATLAVYDVPGTCSGGTCSYTTHTQYCAYGCVADACKGDPCAGVACATPPASYCSGANELTVYDAPGTCNAGACSYGNHTAYCQYGCTNGACANDPCQGVSCATPPASYCTDASTLRSFAAPGTCSKGTCTYGSSDQTCSHGCANGVCQNCASQADCGSGQWCNAGTCVACDTATACGPSCVACSGTTPSCGGAAIGCQCATSPDSCGGTSSYCTGGACAACGPSACGNGRCDCGETTTTCPNDCGPACPTALSLGTFDAGTDGWTFDGLWRRDGGGYMVAGSTSKYSSSYTQNLTSGSNVDLSGCTTATLGFSVRLADDPNYYNKGSDKSERLYVQCSGDGGGTWTNLTPSPWPANQSACSTSYCSGSWSTDRSFPWTAQAITLPAACLTTAVRFRFQAKGSNVWNLQNPGWYVDSVKVN